MTSGWCCYTHAGLHGNRYRRALAGVATVPPGSSRLPWQQTNRMQRRLLIPRRRDAEASSSSESLEIKWTDEENHRHYTHHTHTHTHTHTHPHTPHTHTHTTHTHTHTLKRNWKLKRKQKKAENYYMVLPDLVVFWVFERQVSEIVWQVKILCVSSWKKL